MKTKTVMDMVSLKFLKTVTLAVLMVVVLSACQAVNKVKETQYFTNKRVLKNPDNVHHFIFSPDGKDLVAWGYWNEQAYVWDIGEKRIKKRLKKGYRDSSEAYSYAYSHDGDYLITAQTHFISVDEKYLQYAIRETQDYEIVDQWTLFDNNLVGGGLQATPDNYFSGYTGFDPKVFDVPEKTFNVFDIGSHKIIRGAEIRTIKALKFQPDGRGFAVSIVDDLDDGNSKTNEIRLEFWRYPELEKRFEILDPHPERFSKITFSPDGKHLYSWIGINEDDEGFIKVSGQNIRQTPGLGEPIKVWDTQTGDLVNTILGYMGVPFSFDMMPDGKHLLITLSGGYRQAPDYLILVDVETGQTIEQMKLDYHQIEEARYSKTTNTIAISLFRDHRILLFDVNL